jgi:hypothetical protein
LRLDRWFEELNGLTAEASEWDTIGDFLRRVGQLAESRAQERRESWGKLRQALVGLNADAQSELGYFGQSDVGGWEAERCPIGMVAAVMEQLEEFGSTLRLHGLLRTRVAATLSEDQERLRTIGQIQQEIASRFALLGDVFKGKGAPDTASPPPPREQPQSEQTGKPQNAPLGAVGSQQPQDEPEPTPPADGPRPARAPTLGSTPWTPQGARAPATAEPNASCPAEVGTTAGSAADQPAVEQGRRPRRNLRLRHPRTRCPRMRSPAPCRHRIRKQVQTPGAPRPPWRLYLLSYPDRRRRSLRTSCHRPRS